VTWPSLFDAKRAKSAKNAKRSAIKMAVATGKSRRFQARQI
jgi:hypothetical protein